MKKISFFFSLALALPCFAAPAPAQDKAQPDTPPATAKKMMRVRQGGSITAKRVTHRVQPEYPSEARQQGISGTVKLHVIIARDGSVAQLELISGPPSLAQAAIDAVRQWKYSPASVEGEAVEVETTVDVIFSLNR